MVIFLDMEGNAVKIEPQHVYQGSDNVTGVTVVAPYPATTAMEIGFILPNGLYWTGEQDNRYMPMALQEQNAVSGVCAWTYRLPRSVTELVGDLQVAINAVTTEGNTTSYLCKVQVEESVLPNLPTQPEPDVYALIRQYLAQLDGRTVNVPNLVWKIQKVAPNAITYTNNSKVESAPIVIEGGESVPIPVNAAGVVKIEKPAWEPVYAANGTTVTGYKYTVTSGLHGQMRDGATANDLWVSFDEAQTSAFRGAYEDYTVDASGDITISVSAPVDMTVRVWNGKGLKGEDGVSGTVQWGVNAPSKISTLQWKQI